MPIGAGLRAFVVLRVENPAGSPVPDGDGGYTQTWTPGNPPDWHVAIGGGRAERLTDANAVADTTAITVTGPYRSDVSTRTRLIRADGSILNVRAIQNADGRPIELVLTCAGA